MNEHSSALLAVFAHPDDETYRAGGTLAALSRRGVRVQVLTATRGEAGSCGDLPHCARDELAAVREAELRCACVALGIEAPILLDYRDGHLAEADPETIIAEILTVAGDVRPQAMLTFGPDGLSGHPDHIAIGALATEAYQRADFINALYTVAVPQSIADALGMTQIHALSDDEITLTVPIDHTWEAKMAAIRCHATQYDASPINRASPERQRLFLGTEHFVRVATREGFDPMGALA
jgi:LmbE family N-acetylglucosaminyl deacetylase